MVSCAWGPRASQGSCAWGSLGPVPRVSKPLSWRSDGLAAAASPPPIPAVSDCGQLPPASWGVTAHVNETPPRMGQAERSGVPGAGGAGALGRQGLWGRSSTAGARRGYGVTGPAPGRGRLELPRSGVDGEGVFAADAVAEPGDVGAVDVHRDG